jgi:hypothetical protein
MNDVQKYSSDVALGDGVVQILPKSAAKEFVKGPILWPSLYIYKEDNTCNLVVSIIDAVIKVTDLLKLTYDTENRPKRPPVSFDPFKLFIEGWQRGSDTGENFVNTDGETEDTSSPPRQRIAPADTTPWYIKYPVDFVTRVTGLTEVPMIGLALQLPEVISRMFRCDVEAIMFCTSHHYSVFTSAFIAIIILTILGGVFSSTGVPIVATLLSVLAFTSLVLFISFDYAPACAPLIPTCFFDSIVEDVVLFLPNRITLPQSLVSCQWDQNTEGPPPASCIVSCDQDPYKFIDWTSNVAWMMCEFYPGLCSETQVYMANPGNVFSLILGDEITKSMVSALYRSRLIIGSQDQNLKDGFSWCNALTLYKLLPLLVFIFIVITSIPLLVAIILRTFVGLLRTGFSAFAMTHS